MIVVVMGVSGVGKTTIGKALALELGWRFIDADGYHPPANVAKMAAGIALDDADRWPWLEALNRVLRREENAVLACSALKEAYRSRITAGLARCEIVYLHGSLELIRARLVERPHSNGSGARRNGSLDALTQRENEVLGLLAEGLRQEEIADRLVISPKTVATHIQRILGKLEVRSRAQAVSLALREERDVSAHAQADPFDLLIS